MHLHDPATGQKLLTSWESLSVTEAALELNRFAVG